MPQYPKKGKDNTLNRPKAISALYVHSHEVYTLLFNRFPFLVQRFRHKDYAPQARAELDRTHNLQITDRTFNVPETIVFTSEPPETFSDS